jgi:DNA-binding NtrC family response regulator
MQDDRRKLPSVPVGRAASARPMGAECATRGGSAVTNQILFVDDDRRALDGYKRLLRGVFEIETAGSGIQGLATIHVLGPFAVIVSDMRMTGMNGAEFLARVRELAPQTVRMLLTGYRDMDLAIEAVNDGQIFRYLNKPCSKDELVSAIRLGLAKYQSDAEDDELINETRQRRMEAARDCSCETIPQK